VTVMRGAPQKGPKKSVSLCFILIGSPNKRSAPGGDEKEKEKSHKKAPRRE